MDAWAIAFPKHTTGDLAHNPGMCPDWELNQRPSGLQAGAQPTEPHQPGQGAFDMFNIGLTDLTALTLKQWSNLNVNLRLTG